MVVHVIFRCKNETEQQNEKCFRIEVECIIIIEVIFGSPRIRVLPKPKI